MQHIKIFSVAFILCFSTGSSFSQISWETIFPAEVDLLNETDYYAHYSISASNENNATVVGYTYYAAPYPNAHYSHFIKRTTNGGISWNAQNSGLPDYYDIAKGRLILSVCSIDSMNIVAVGDSGLILKTTDAGSTWKQLNAPIKTRFFTVNFSDANHGIIAGNYGTVWITDDGGTSWKKREELTQSTFHIAKAFKNGCYYIFDKYYFRLFRTFDNGSTWDSIQITDKSLKDTLQSETHDVYFFDSLHFILAGGHQDRLSGGYTRHLYMVETTDGGTNWSPVINDTSDIDLPFISVAFADKLTGIATSGYGHNRITRDGGKIWKKCTIDSGLIYVGGIVFLDGKSFLAINAEASFYSGIVSGKLLDEGVSFQVPEAENFRIFPNPVSSEMRETRISFTLASESNVTFSVYDILGRQVRKSDIGYHSNGVHQFTFDASALPAGNYSAVLEAEGKRLTKQILILR